MAQTSTHLGRGTLSRDRRAQARQAVRSLAYVELGDGNGGVALNVSEGGIAIQAVMALNADDFPALRIQLAHSKKQIEAKGRVAWTSNLRRIAGLEFVDLSDESRIQIREWISLESSDLRPVAPAARPDNGENSKKSTDPERAGLTIDLAVSAALEQKDTPRASPPLPLVPAEVSAPRKQPRPAVLPAAEVPPAFVPGPYQFAGPDRRGPADTLNPAGDKSGGSAKTPEPRQAAAPAIVNIDSDTARTASTLAARLPGASVTLRGPAEVPEDRYGLARQTKGKSRRGAPSAGKNESAGTLAWICVLTLVSLGAGWFAGRGDWKDVAQRMRAAISKNAGVIEPETQPAAAAKPPEIEIVDANNHHWLIPMNSQGPAGATAPTQSISGAGSHRNAMSIPKANLPPPLGLRSAANAANATPPEVKSPEAEPNSSFPMSAPSGPGGSGNLSAPRPPVGAQAGIRPGDLIHKVDPRYPKAAITEKVEGVVKIVAVIGADGNVKGVQPLSGPRLLIPAALDAIRQWRYSPTLLNGQPIETQRQISVTFRLAQTF